MPPHFKNLNALFLLAALGVAATSQADDPGCKPLLASLSKYIDTPSHTYSESSKGTQSAVQKTETINTGTQRFLLAGGSWMLSKMTTGDLKAQTQQNLSAAHCQYVHDEMVGAESAALYAFKVNNDLADSDGHLWISKRSGLPLKQEQTINIGDTPAEAMHVSQRMNYDDVKAPAVGH
jgi:hypothetical protein